MSSKYSKQCFRQAVKRTAAKLMEENRLKRRKLGAGPKEKLDSSDEEDIAKSIEDKSTLHGRRHDTVLYTGHTVRKRDFLSVANWIRYNKGKTLIKSCSTDYRRGNIRSLQAKEHRGKALFCCRKPPKTLTEHSELTHHQRAWKRNWFLDMGGKEKTEHYKFIFHIAQDDKAYIRPTTSIGLEKSRSQRVFQSTQNPKELPMHDFADNKSFITPSSQRIIEKIEVGVDGKDTIVANFCVY